MIPVGSDLLVQTDTAALRLEGGVATVVRDRVLPALHDGPDDDTLHRRLADLPAAELDRVLTHLVGAGVVLEGERDQCDGWLSLVAGSRLERTALAERADTARVVVIGEGPVAAMTAGVLAEAGLSHADVVAPAGLDRAATTDLVRGNDFALTIVDRRLSAVRHWVNAAGLAEDVPTLHVDVRGHRADVGPLVLPGRGPCHLCWRMRALACAEDFGLAMAREETLDGVRTPPESARPVFPTLPPWVAGVVGHEILAVLLGVARPRLAGTVLAIDAIELTEGVHPVLPRPDCPACAKKSDRRVSTASRSLNWSRSRGGTPISSRSTPRCTVRCAGSSATSPNCRRTRTSRLLRSSSRRSSPTPSSCRPTTAWSAVPARGRR